MHKKVIFFVLGLTSFLSVGTKAQVAINSKLFGQNTWYINVDPTLNSTNFSTIFDERLPDIVASGVKYMRIGGIDPNYIPLYNWDPSLLTITDISKLTHLIDELRTNNIEPIIEVGFNPVCPTYPIISGFTYTPLGSYTKEQQAVIAANLVTAINNHYIGLGSPPVLNWIIANEPDHTLSCATFPTPCKGYGYDNTSGTDAILIASYIQIFSKAMKDALNTITIIGPELTTYGNDSGWKGNTLMNDLISNPTLNPTKSIMGTIGGVGSGAGKYFIDVISFHYYPNTTCSTTRADIIADPTQCKNGFTNNLSSSGYVTTGNCAPGITRKGLVEMITLNNTGRTLTGSTAIGIACTEFNLPNNPIGCRNNESTNYQGVIKDIDCRSFLGGQWMAEVLCLGMAGTYNTTTLQDDPWVVFMNPWSAKEGDCTTGQGYISSCGTSNNKRPTYWHYKMVADNFKGNYLKNILGNTGNYKAFGYKNSAANEVGVIIMNQTIQNPRGTDNTTVQFKVNFNSVTPSGVPMLFSFNAANTAIGVSGTYSCSITNETTMLLVFDANTGALKKRQTYSLQDALRTTDTGTMTIIASTSDYSGYVNNVRSDIKIGTGTSISAGTNNKTFRATNSIQLNGPFTSTNGYTLSLQIDQACP